VIEIVLVEFSSRDRGSLRWVTPSSTIFLSRTVIQCYTWYDRHAHARPLSGAAYRICSCRCSRTSSTFTLCRAPGRRPPASPTSSQLPRNPHAGSPTGPARSVSGNELAQGRRPRRWLSRSSRLPRLFSLWSLPFLRVLFRILPHSAARRSCPSP